MAANLNSAEYEALMTQITALSSSINNLNTKLTNLTTLLSSKLDSSTFKQMNTIIDNRFQHIEETINDINQFATPDYFLNRTNHTGDEIVDGNCQLGGNANDTVGFYGEAGVTRQLVSNPSNATAGATYTAAEQAMLQNIHSTLNSLVTALKNINIVG